MNKIEVKCFINGENELGSSSLYLSRTEPWDQVVYKMSLKVNKPQGSNPLVYNENGVVVKSVAELEDGQKLYFAANGEEFVPIPGSCIFYSFDYNYTLNAIVFYNIERNHYFLSEESQSILFIISSSYSFKPG